MTLKEALTSAANQLKQRVDIAEWATRDATLLLQHLLGVSRAYLLAHPEQHLHLEDRVEYQQLIQRRLLAEPIQYITGEQEFYGRTFRLTQDVLIPRPETELLIDLAKQRFTPDAAIRIADVGTGSGILAITLALEFPNATITALDLSPAALRIAQTNATLHHADSVRFAESDLFSALDPQQHFDLVVSNPPYIAEGDRTSMHTQVTEYEPSFALFAGTDGNSIYRRLIPQAFSHLEPGGWLLMEQGTQGRALLPLLEDWQQVTLSNDLQNIPRAIAAQKP